MDIKAVFFNIETLLIDAPSGKSVKLRQGIIELLRELKSHKLKLVLISNGSFPDEKSLERFKLLPYFDLKIWDARYGKANPLFLYEALHDLANGVASGQSVYIGEQFEGDVRNALRAGMWVIWLNPHQEKRQIRFGWEVKGIDEVRGIIEKNLHKIDISSLQK